MDANNVIHYHMDANGNVRVMYAPEVEERNKFETGDALIERMERETGCRIDSNGFNNAAIGGLMAAMARALGKNPHPPEMDVVVGTVMRHQMSPAGRKEQESREALAGMLRAGIDPADIMTLRGAINGN